MRILALLALVGCGGAPVVDSLDAALDACARGDLDAAERLAPVHLRARILMMRNRNREAIELLTPLLAGKAKTYEAMERQQQVLPDLALAYVRQDDFLNAARIYGALGEAIAAKKYETLSRVVAYLSNVVDEVSVDFHVTDPVPVVAGTVDGKKVLFLIDTLLDQVVLERGFARRSGIESTVAELGVGRATVKNVPIHLGDPIRIGDLRVDGAIGLQFLMHFDFTLDYRRSRLVLRKAGGAIVGHPAYLVGDRYLLTAASINMKDRVFAAVGTSLRGVTLAASEHLVHALGGEVREFAAGPHKLVKPALDYKAFPAGLDGSFGVPVAVVLGHAALRGKVLRVEPRSMKIAID